MRERVRWRVRLVPNGQLSLSLPRGCGTPTPPCRCLFGVCLCLSVMFVSVSICVCLRCVEIYFLVCQAYRNFLDATCPHQWHTRGNTRPPSRKDLNHRCHRPPRLVPPDGRTRTRAAIAGRSIALALANATRSAPTPRVALATASASAGHTATTPTGPSPTPSSSPSRSVRCWWRLKRGGGWWAGLAARVPCAWAGAKHDEMEMERGHALRGRCLEKGPQTRKSTSVRRCGLPHTQSPFPVHSMGDRTCRRCLTAALCATRLPFSAASPSTTSLSSQSAGASEGGDAPSFSKGVGAAERGRMGVGIALPLARQSTNANTRPLAP